MQMINWPTGGTFLLQVVIGLLWLHNSFIWVIVFIQYHPYLHDIS